MCYLINMSMAGGNALRTDVSRRERQILDVLYRLGEASANDVVRELPAPLANATVRTQLRIMEQKGIVQHRCEGKRFMFRPSTPRQSAAKAALRGVLNVFFGGSLEDALATHLSDPKAKLDAEQLLRLRKLIEKHESTRR